VPQQCMGGWVITMVCIKITDAPSMAQYCFIVGTSNTGRASFFDMLVLIYQIRGWNTVVSTATHYVLDGLQFEPQWGQDIFSYIYLFRPALRPTQPLLQRVLGLCPTGKEGGAWC
jgi:hypothetical protein